MNETATLRRQINFDYFSIGFFFLPRFNSLLSFKLIQNDGASLVYFYSFYAELMAINLLYNQNGIAMRLALSCSKRGFMCILNN